ncbi:MAG: CoA-binding protein [Bacteroidota bacterium]|nr:CoA-binding protein [Bacteroidota bacterium]
MKIKDILSSGKSIAIVGFSDNRLRPSNRIGRYLHGNGFKIFGVNPKLDKKEIDEITCYASLKDLPENIDIVNIFRRSEFVEDLMKEILALDYKPEMIWTQIGVISMEAKELALANDIIYVENKCIMVEHAKI